MKQKIKHVLFSLLVVIGVPLLLASGDGGGGGGKGGSGGGKGGGSTPPVNTGWLPANLYEDWRYSQLPMQNTCFYSHPISNGTNTYPDMPAQTIYSLPANYYCKITVIDITNNDRKFYKRADYSNSTPIEIPNNHTYKIEYEFIEGCMDCMKGSTVPIPIGEGKRIKYTAAASFTINNGSPQIYPVYKELIPCN